jgi:NADPH:quinone reductase-like Zn-dependent oxidoreductase
VAMPDIRAKMMKAVVYDRYGDADVLLVHDIRRPARPTSGEVHVRVMAAALNPKDVLVRRGKFKLVTGWRFPRGVGYDFAGTVIAGARFASGTRVYGMVNGWRGRTFAEEVVCAADECDAMPALSFEEAAGIPLAGQTALQAVRDIGRVCAGATVCINGASGGVGVFAVQIAKALGARVTTLSSARNIDFCHSLGADEALDYARDEPFTRPGAFDVIFDVFGNRGFARVVSSLKQHGVFIEAVPSPSILLAALGTSFISSKRARLVIVRSRAADLATLRHWVEEGRLSPVVDRVYDLEQAADAQRYLETKRARGKVVVRIGR